ncbi:cell division protein FtsQ/DivIB [Rickettsiella endosymbiont of Aleochara curtula]|jgi:cell division protein FtsQ|uniref:cell division protein FtsQ/DivIB n=1 Tax=Rickettsiella endosymbiont of Aleochara curtula TaxID=3077936 RepID=UPI00313BEB57
MVKNGKVVENQRFQRQRDKPRLIRLSSQLPSRRWFFKFSLSLLLILSCVLLWQKLSNPSCFPVKNIKISGDLTYVKQSHLQQIILPFIAKGFFRLDSQGLKEQILHVPWIASVSVKRYWPDTLAVSFITKKPIAFIGKHGLLDAQGNIFIPDGDSIALDLPIFVGPVGQQKYLLQTYNTLNPMFAQLNLKIKFLQLIDEQYWHLKLNNGLTVYLSRSQPYIQLERLVDVYPDVIASKVSMVDYVDLRYAHGMAVKFKKRIS